jgi:two-component system, response regulator PdtaR
VLVVEDEPLIRMAAVDLVENAGYAALEAGNADEAIRILEQRADIRLVFTDIDMPGTMDGLKLARLVRDRWPPVHIILVSGKTLVDRGDLPSGAEFFPKPYAEPVIRDAMLRFLGG